MGRFVNAPFRANVWKLRGIFARGKCTIARERVKSRRISSHISSLLYYENAQVYITILHRRFWYINALLIRSFFFFCNGPSGLNYQLYKKIVIVDCFEARNKSAFKTFHWFELGDQLLNWFLISFVLYLIKLKKKMFRIRFWLNNFTDQTFVY